MTTKNKETSKGSKKRRNEDEGVSAKKKRKYSNSYDESDLNTIFNNKIQFQGVMRKYWAQRQKLFSKYDEGIVLTKELWFSVTPENIAKYIAEFIGSKFETKFQILDTFCGGGGNIVQLLNLKECKVYGVDINETHLQCTKSNAIVYHGSEDVKNRLKLMKIDWNCLDEETDEESVKNIRELKKMNMDCVFGSPPWGGPEYIKSDVYDLETMLQPCGLSKHLKDMKQFSKNVCLFLPKNSDLEQVKLATAVNGYSKVKVIHLENGDAREKGVLCCWGVFAE